MRTGARCVAIVLALCGLDEAIAATDASLFDANDPIAVTLTGPFGALARDRSADPAYRDATLLWSDAAGAEHRFAIQLKPRGLSRRNPDACQFPPLRIEFAKDEAVDTPFAKLKKIKLVTHCTHLGSQDASYAERLWLELLVYRTLNLLTEESFRVRPLDVTYVDTDRGNRKSRHYAFLIEPEVHLAARTNTTPIAAPAVPRADLDVGQASLVGMFAFMVGNTDFAMTNGPKGSDCCHNVVPLRSPSGSVLPVPYDFDATGVVDPPYAKPTESLHIQNVRQRLYRGYCQDAAQLRATLDRFRAARADIRALFADDPHLSQATVAKTLKFIDAFYGIIDDDKAVERNISSRCL